MLSTYKDRDIPARINARPQERQPALGRKRARFSLRPSTGQSALGGGMSLDTERLQDPDEFFSAFEKIDRAEKELRKQRGEVSDSTQYTLSTRVQSRRPGISGRKASSKQRFSSVIIGPDETLGPHQILPAISGPSNGVPNIMAIDEHGVSPQKELAAKGSKVAEERNRVDGLFEELLSEDSSNLDGLALKLLQERLQIRIINLDKFCLPEMDGIRESSAKVSLEQFPRPIKVLSDIQNLTKRVKSKAFVETQEAALQFTYSLDNASPPNISFSSVSMSTSYHSQEVQSDNPFLFPPGDQSPTRDSIHVEGIESASSRHVDLNSEPAEVKRKELRFSDDRLMIKGRNPADCDEVIDKVVTADSTLLLDSVNDKSAELSEDVDICGLDNKVEDMQKLDMVDTDMFLNDPAHSVDFAENKVEHVQQLQTYDKVKNPALSDLVLDKLVSGSKEETFFDSQGWLESEGDDEFLSVNGDSSQDDHSKDGHSIDTNICPEQNNEIHQNSPKESPKIKNNQIAPSRHDRKRQVSPRNLITGVDHLCSGESLTVQSKQKVLTHYVRERREFSRRRSLDGAGTQWQGHVRRSTRIKMKPLEYWRGERLLYGRVHQSLLTVIGRKYASPVKGDGHLRLKVQSFVSDRYKDLIEKVST